MQDSNHLQLTTTMALTDAQPYGVLNYPLDEASGSAIDAVGSADLTANGTIGTGTGLQYSTARDLESGDPDSFSRADETVFDLLDTRWMIIVSVKLESKGADRVFVAKWDFGSNKSYSLRYSTADDRFQLDVRDGSAVQGFVNAGNFGSPSTATWYTLYAWHDSTANQLGISINAGTANTSSHSTGINNSTAAFFLGHEEGGNAGYHDGLIQDVIILNGYILDATERTEHYNSGDPVPFSEWAGGAETYTGAAALTVGAATLSASGTFIKPTYTGTAALTVGRATLTGSASFTKPTYTGVGTLTVAPVTLSGVATFTKPTYTGSTSLTVAASILSGSGAFTKPTYTGTSTLVVGAATFSGAGTFTKPTYTGSATLTVGAATFTGVGAFTKPTYTGTATLSTGTVTLAGSGIFASAVFSGNAALVTPRATLSASGTFTKPTYTGTASLTVGRVTFAGVATHISGDAVLGPYIVDASNVFLPGMTRGNVFQLGIETGNIYLPGAKAWQALEF